MSNTYPTDKKRRLVDRIHNVKSKEHLKTIKGIIVSTNPELSFMKNNNGLFAEFQSLNTQTYLELEKFLNKLDKAKQKREESEMDALEIMSSDMPSTMTDEMPKKQEYSKKLRLTNTETHLLNRARYEKEIKKNENSDNDDVYDDYNPTTLPKIESPVKPPIKKLDSEIFFKKSKK